MSNRAQRAAMTLLATVLAAGPATRPATGPATGPAATAVEAAERYTRRFQHRDGAAAVEATWDMDGMFDGMFGDAMNTVSAADRADMRRRMVAFLKGVMASPQVADAMATADYAHFAAGATDAAGRTPVTFDVTFRGRVLHNELDLVRKGDQWRIVDGVTNGRLMAKTIRDAYAKDAATAATPPPAFIKAMTAGQK